jgi:hypothetical protein
VGDLAGIAETLMSLQHWEWRRSAGRPISVGHPAAGRLNVLFLEQEQLELIDVASRSLIREFAKKRV